MSSSSDIIEGSSILLNCVARGSGVLQFTWYHNNKVLTNPNNTLFLKNISRQDSGMYKCAVDNRQVKATVSEEFQVQVFCKRNFVSKLSHVTKLHHAINDNTSLIF